MEEGAAAVAVVVRRRKVVAVMVVVGVSGEVEAGEEGAEGRVAVDKGGDMGGAGFDEGAKRKS